MLYCTALSGQGKQSQRCDVKKHVRKVGANTDLTGQ